MVFNRKNFSYFIGCSLVTAYAAYSIDMESIRHFSLRSNKFEIEMYAMYQVNRVNRVHANT